MDYWTSCLCSVLLSALVLARGTSGQDITMMSSSIRLVSGDLNYGRLEVYYNGQWGTVCDDNFDDTAAMVACRQLGLDSYTVAYYGSARFGEGTGFIWLDEVRCNGSESSLFACRHDPIGMHDCSHSEDVGISCGTGTIPTPSSGSSFSGIGGWLSIAVVFFVIIAAVSAYRRRRMYQYRRSQQTTCTTTIVTPPVTTTAPQGNSGMPMYYHNSQQPGVAPTPTPAPAGPSSYPRQPQQPYPQQPYPQQSQPQQQPYPPPSVGGSGPPAANPYPVQPYPPPSVGGAEPPAANPYPPQSYPPPTGASAPYPPQPVGADAPPMYPPQATSAAADDLPPPPAYNDVVTQ